MIGGMDAAVPPGSFCHAIIHARLCSLSKQYKSIKNACRECKFIIGYI